MPKKIKLDLNELEVKSFTTKEENSQRGGGYTRWRICGSEICSDSFCKHDCP